MSPICRQRAFVSLHWPGMNISIRNTSYTCHKYNERSSFESQEPIVRTPALTYPFQNVCADYFETQRHSYLTYVDHFSGWISYFTSNHTKPPATTWYQNVVHSLKTTEPLKNSAQMVAPNLVPKNFNQSSKIVEYFSALYQLANHSLMDRQS